MATEIEATYRVVTPMFCGGANPGHAELRIPSFKGVLRFWWRALAWSRQDGDLEMIRREEDKLFGSAGGGRSRVSMSLAEPIETRQLVAGRVLEDAGNVVGEGARSLTGSYRWATCPHLIERYRRDLGRAGLQPLPDVPSVNLGAVLAAGDGSLFLEERQFRIDGRPPDDLVAAAKLLLLHEETRARLPDQIAVLNDDDFAWFARYGLAIQARNVLDCGTKQSKNLWYEETLPADTVLYAIVMGRSEDAADALGSLFPDGDPYLQAGGNETIGHGWFAVTPRRRESERGQ